LESFTEAVYQRTLSIDGIKIIQGTPDVDLNTIGVTKVGGMTVEVIDPTEDYLKVSSEAIVVLKQ